MEFESDLQKKVPSWSGFHIFLPEKSLLGLVLNGTQRYWRSWLSVTCSTAFCSNARKWAKSILWSRNLADRYDWPLQMPIQKDRDLIPVLHSTLWGMHTCSILGTEVHADDECQRERWRLEMSIFNDIYCPNLNVYFHQSQLVSVRDLQWNFHQWQMQPRTIICGAKISSKMYQSGHFSLKVWLQFNVGALDKFIKSCALFAATK